MTLATLVLLASPAFAGGSVVPAAAVAPVDVPALDSAVSFDAGVDIRGVMTQQAAAWPRALSPWRWRPQPKPKMPWRDSLDLAVLDFLETFVEKRDAKTAVERHFSTNIDDEKLVPPDDLQDYMSRFDSIKPPLPLPAMPITNAEALKRVTAQLARHVDASDPGAGEESLPRIPEGLSSVLEIKEIREGMSEEGIVLLIHPGNKIASYPVARDNDIGWALFPWFQSKTILERTIGEDLHLRAVFVLFKYHVGKRVGYTPLFMLWANEEYWPEGAGRQTDSWKLWAVTAIPTE